VSTTTAEISDDAAIERRFTLRERILLWLLEWAGYLFTRVVGSTLRVTFSVEEGGPPAGDVAPVIYAMWHRCVLPATYCFRDRQIAVITSRSFDGEYIARIIERFGFRAVRGSSSRGGAGALLASQEEINQGRSVGFTIDGPRGPRYVAKPGAVMLARNTGAPLVPLYVAPDKAWVLNSWDRFMIPKPFSRVVVHLGKIIQVSRAAEGKELDRYQAELQASLERVQAIAEEKVGAL
jgi:lysophospholipid acyltransferase (LPLAT)-like uncharacterized protein